jgi:hypothetical protein
MIATRAHTAALALVGALAVGTLVIGAPPIAALAGETPAAAQPLASAAKVKGGLAVLLSTRTVIPKIQRTVHFTGYATYTFRAPRGRRIVSASARIVGAEPHSVAIRNRTVSGDRERYTVKLVFPGEQGNPGKLRVVLGSIA